jgi:hypothetical protein
MTSLTQVASSVRYKSLCLECRGSKSELANGIEKRPSVPVPSLQGGPRSGRDLQRPSRPVTVN